MKLGKFGGRKSDGVGPNPSKRGLAKLAGGLPFLLLALAAWAVALAGQYHAPVVNILLTSLASLASYRVRTD